MTKSVSIINMKGGVGKSTLTVNLAWHFAAYTHWVKKVLVVDLDPQFNASQYLLGVTKYREILNQGKSTTWNILENNTRTPTGQNSIIDPHKAIHNVATFVGSKGRIDLIPSRLELALSLKNPAQKERQLSKMLAKIENEYDLILIDCAPTESVLTTAAYLSSDYLLVPVKPEYLSSIGLPLLVNSMNDFKNEYEDSKLSLAGVVFNATENYYPEEQLSKNMVRDLANKQGWYVFQAEVPYSKSFPKGAREGRPIIKTSYARTAQKTRFLKFAEEFAKRISL
ncbi:MAG: ParA family protein [Nostocales cyanobacterium LE14-WE4]|jgi:chromosome partitioning protein|nr:ParA family protein [Anabaena sp. 49633_E8]MCE2700582.1 ParA family protein [Anabaena sp. 49633_E8]MDJ0499650.1 ParA family protein [Nostocales cyanobacterium LE14-WE4]